MQVLHYSVSLFACFSHVVFTSFLTRHCLAEHPPYQLLMSGDD